MTPSALLAGKTAVIYGGGGAIGRGVALTFASEGARVFLAGRTQPPLDQVAAEIAAAGGQAEVAVVDALDESAVDTHAAAVAAAAGHLDISFNLISRGDSQGTPLVEMTTDRFLDAVVTGLRTTFLTARAAVRQMAEHGSGGVILHLTSGSARGTAPGMGNTGPADAATEAFLRYLAAENGPRGIRVAGIHTAGVRGTLTREKIAATTGGPGVDPDLALAGLAGMTMLRRVPELQQIADTAAFLASDKAGAITSQFVNATCGLVPG